MSQVLYRSADVRNKIIDILENSHGRRVVITAFVGEGADAYIPNPKGIQVICWPKAGGTNPKAVRQLLNNGAKVFFCKSLHMKVYWTEDMGTVITSANLTQNALGAGNLREVGIWIEPGKFNIDRVLSSLSYWKPTAHDLYELDNAHHEYYIANKLKSDSATLLTYPEWYRSAHRARWHICWWSSSNVYLAETAKPVLFQKYRVTTAQEYFNSNDKADYPKNIWVLCFTSYGKRLTTFSWMHIDLVVRVSKSDKKAYEPGYPFQFIQIWKRKSYPPPPFVINNAFREALRKAAKKATWDKLDTWAKPTPNFLKWIDEFYK